MTTTTVWKHLACFLSHHHIIALHKIQGFLCNKTWSIDYAQAFYKFLCILNSNTPTSVYIHPNGRTWFSLTIKWVKWLSSCMCNMTGLSRDTKCWEILLSKEMIMKTIAKNMASYYFIMNTAISDNLLNIMWNGVGPFLIPNSGVPW